MASLTDVRKFTEAAAGKLSPAKAQELAKGLMQGQGKEQVQKAAQELLDWSNKNRTRVTDLVRKEVSSQLKTFGVASRGDLDALKRRVRELERGGGSKKATAKPKTAAKKKSTAKRTSTPSGTAGSGGGSA
jgi:polyhydroxyalkanoate synthesis regulator phasin